MSSHRRLSLERSFPALGAAILLTLGIAHSQSTSVLSAQPAPGESSSLSYQFLADDLNAAATPEPAGGGGGQYDNRGAGHRGLFSRWAFEAGAGANGPAPSSSSYITWGANLNVGGGFHFTRALTLLVEYQFIDDKLPAAVIAPTGADGGNAHIWSFTLAPVVDLFPKKINSVYITGGGGFYRKVTNFTDPLPYLYCNYFYCGIYSQNTVVGHFSSNQGGMNVGAGFSHKLGGVDGDGQTKLFAEARYLWIDTPQVNSQPNGLGATRIAAGTELIPISLGIRF